MGQELFQVYRSILIFGLRHILEGRVDVVYVLFRCCDGFVVDIAFARRIHRVEVLIEYQIVVVLRDILTEVIVLL